MHGLEGNGEAQLGAWRSRIFNVLDNSRQTRNGVNEKLINSFDKIGIRVKKGAVHAQEHVATGRFEPDHWTEWIPYERLVAIAFAQA